MRPESARQLVLLGEALSAPPSAAADQPPLEEAIRSLLQNALEIKITASLLPHSASAGWNTQQSELTIPGRSVEVELRGNNLRVQATFTPYWEAPGQLTLVAQGQLWLSATEAQEIRYVTTYRSLNISFGEKILFYPLGISGDLVETLTLQLEIQVEPYVADDPEDQATVDVMPAG